MDRYDNFDGDDLPPPPPNPEDGPARGRPRKLTIPLIVAARQLLLTGAPESAVWKRLLVSKSTWASWKKSGRDHAGSIYRTFLDMVVSSKAEYHTNACKIINDAMMDDGHLALAVLERRFPREWGRYRGELGDLKKRLKELEGELEKVKAAKAKKVAR